MSDQHKDAEATFGVEAHAYCGQCGYSLVGLRGTICPECGRSFNPQDARTYRRRPGGRGRILRIWARRILVLMICFAMIAGGGLLWVWWDWRSEQEVVQRLHDLGATVGFKPVAGRPFGFLTGDRFGRIGERVDLIGFRQQTPPGEIAKLNLKSLKRLKSIFCEEAKLNSADVAKIAEVRSLEVLIADWVQIDDAELAELSNLSNLWFLDIKGSKVTDAGAVYLRKFTRLRRLDIRYTGISDAGLENLTGLTELELLGVGGRPSDGVSPGVSPEGIKKLKKALPNVR